MDNNRFVIVAMLVATSTAFAQGGRSPRVAPDLNLSAASNPVIIRYAQGAVSKGASSIKNLRKRGTFANIDMVHADLTGAELNQLMTDPAVEYVSPDRPVEGAGSNILGPSDVRNRINVPYNLNSQGARGIGVAIVDSGMAPDATFLSARRPASQSAAASSRATLPPPIPTDMEPTSLRSPRRMGLASIRPTPRASFTTPDWRMARHC